MRAQAQGTNDTEKARPRRPCIRSARLGVADDIAKGIVFPGLG